MKYFKIFFISFLFLLIQPLSTFGQPKHNVLILNPINDTIFSETIIQGLELSLLENNIELSHYIVNNSADEEDIKNIENLAKKNNSIAIISLSPDSTRLLTHFAHTYLSDFQIHILTIQETIDTYAKALPKNFHVQPIFLDFDKKIDTLINLHTPKAINFLVDRKFENSTFYQYLLDYIDSKPNVKFKFILTDVHDKIVPKLSGTDIINIVFSPLLKYSNDGLFKSKLTPFGTMSKIAAYTDTPTYGAFKEFASQFNIGALNYSGIYVGHKLAYSILENNNLAPNKFSSYTCESNYDFFINKHFNKLNFFENINLQKVQTYSFDSEIPVYEENKKIFLYIFNIMLISILIILFVRYIFLKKLYAERIKINKMQNNFTANISHELRTPLNIIISTISLFELYKKTGEISFNSSGSLKKFNYLKKNSFRLLKLINNIIDSSRIESGFFTLEREKYNIVEIVEDITLSSIAYAEQKNITLIFDTTFEEIYTLVDRDKLERVILNLLSNSLKFTNSGGHIQVLVNKKNPSTLTITVSDDGIGISKDDQEKIFDRFIQSSNKSLNKCSGSGIGLSLCYSIINEHNGKISVKSNLHQGTSFIIELPIIKSSTATTQISQSRLSELAEIEFSDQ